MGTFSKDIKWSSSEDDNSRVLIETSISKETVEAEFITVNLAISETHNFTLLADEEVYIYASQNVEIGFLTETMTNKSCVIGKFTGDVPITITALATCVLYIFMIKE